MSPQGAAPFTRGLPRKTFPKLKLWLHLGPVLHVQHFICWVAKAWREKVNCDILFFHLCITSPRWGVGHFQLKKVVPDSDGKVRNCIASVGNPFSDGSKEKISTLPSACRPTSGYVWSKQIIFGTSPSLTASSWRHPTYYPRAEHILVCLLLLHHLISKKFQTYRNGTS